MARRTWRRWHRGSGSSTLPRFLPILIPAKTREIDVSQRSFEVAGMFPPERAGKAIIESACAGPNQLRHVLMHKNNGVAQRHGPTFCALSPQKKGWASRPPGGTCCLLCGRLAEYFGGRKYFTDPGEWEGGAEHGGSDGP